jgi:hypothetical protein
MHHQKRNKGQALPTVVKPARTSLKPRIIWREVLGQNGSSCCLSKWRGKEIPNKQHAKRNEGGIMNDAMTLTDCDMVTLTDTSSLSTLNATKSSDLRRLEDVESARMSEIEQLSCSNPEIGSYIKLYGFKDLCDLLDLEDSVFGEVYPELHMNNEQRSKLKKAVIAHRRSCHFCQEVADNHTWADGVLHGLVDLAMQEAFMTDKSSS